MFGAGNETRTRDPDLGKVVRTQAQPIAAGEYPLVLVEHVRRGDAQTTVTDDLAATVVQLLSEVQRHHALAGNLADAVVHLPGRDVYALVASDTASVIV